MSVAGPVIKELAKNPPPEPAHGKTSAKGNNNKGKKDKNAEVIQHTIFSMLFHGIYCSWVQNFNKKKIMYLCTFYLSGLTASDSLSKPFMFKLLLSCLDKVKLFDISLPTFL